MYKYQQAIAIIIYSQDIFVEALIHIEINAKRLPQYAMTLPQPYLILPYLFSLLHHFFFFFWLRWPSLLRVGFL